MICEIVIVLDIRNDGRIYNKQAFLKGKENNKDASAFFKRCVVDIVEENEGKTAINEPDFQEDLSEYLMNGYYCGYGEEVLLLTMKLDQDEKLINPV